MTETGSTVLKMAVALAGIIGNNIDDPRPYIHIDISNCYLFVEKPTCFEDF